MNTPISLRYTHDSFTTLFVTSTGTPLSAISTVLSTASTLPSPPPGVKCDGKIDGGDPYNTSTSYSSQPACAVLTANVTLALLRDCCKSAPIVLYNGGCNAYCNAQDQPLAQLQQCISFDLDGKNPGKGSGIICNRANAIASSVLPVFLTNSYVAASAASPTSAISTMGSISSTGVMGTSFAAAAASRQIRTLSGGYELSVGVCVSVIALILGAVLNATS